MAKCTLARARAETLRRCLPGFVTVPQALALGCLAPHWSTHSVFCASLLDGSEAPCLNAPFRPGPHAGKWAAPEWSGCLRGKASTQSSRVDSPGSMKYRSHAGRGGGRAGTHIFSVKGWWPPEEILNPSPEASPRRDTGWGSPCCPPTRAPATISAAWQPSERSGNWLKVSAPDHQL